MIGPAQYYRDEAQASAHEATAPRGPFDVDALLRADLHPGDPTALKHYWTRGKGLAKWATKPHPWTALYRHLLRYLKNPEYAKRVASQWFHDVFGIWPGERKGKNPIGRG